MELLSLLVVYCALFIVGSLCLLYRDSAVLSSGPIGVLRQSLTESVERLVPRSIQNLLHRLCTYLLYTRNCAFQLIFLVLCVLAHLVWLVDMIPILYHHYPNYNHTLWPFVALFSNYFCWHMAWTGDPGEIKPNNVNEYMQIYKPDGMLYEGNKVCSTCNFKKPVRSKHCAICNRCVHRFDHHCIWTNNCVGGLNQRYFIMFMVTLLAMFLQGIYVGTGCVLQYADDIKLYKASYVDDDGTVKSMTVYVAFQHLFMALPRLVFLIIACVVLSVLVGIFLSHHLYLIFTNQTTNERYKLQDLLLQHADDTVTDDTVTDDTVTDDINSSHSKKKASKVDTISKNVSSKYRPFSKGIVSNFLEVFFPYNFMKSKIKNQ
ncbi:palmitoyltransferase ZDHHC4-like [Ruditapes philippinarum]|uniref:palmitoyltransferase ZDHHC4-like n=1 Tax=Ruditapes philippinarum TaxID=129788 RepID=UPI00295C2899|nr:palmitoyltransferase ZDHHC4-like [Ruditapes philippinarum]